jgi:hypothetical protein
MVALDGSQAAVAVVGNWVELANLAKDPSMLSGKGLSSRRRECRVSLPLSVTPEQEAPLQRPILIDLMACTYRFGDGCNCEG